MGTNETKHLMALNPFRSGNKGHISSLPLAEYDKLISYPWLHEAILQIRGEHQVVGKDMTAAKLKSQLPFRPLLPLSGRQVPTRPHRPREFSLPDFGGYRRGRTRGDCTRNGEATR